MLLFDTALIETDQLLVPHPRMSFRKFVLEPAVEIAGWMLHPTSGWTLTGLLRHLRDSPRLVVVTSENEEIAESLVTHLVHQLKCPVWQGNEESLVRACGFQHAGGVEFVERRMDGPPLIVRLSPAALQNFACFMRTHTDIQRPALIIALDAIGTRQQRTGTHWYRQLSLSPVARISTNDPATVKQEAEAAVRCVWPDLC